MADARSVLLAALESLDRAVEDYGEPRDTVLVVCWAHLCDGQTPRGWNVTDHPSFVLTGLLRDVAGVLERERIERDEPEDDDGS